MDRVNGGEIFVMSEIHVKGLSDLQKFMNRLPAKLEANVMRGALRAGVSQIKDAAVSNCPVGQPSAAGVKRYGLHAGSLRDSIRVGSRIKGGRVEATVKVGGKGKWGDVFFAHIIEFTGAKAHQIPRNSLLRKVFLSFGGGIYASVNHPGMQAKSFLRPALDNQAGNAVNTTAAYMRKRLADKHGLDTSGVMLEGDE